MLASLIIGLVLPVMAVPEGELWIGERAPVLDRVEWLQGSPVGTFEEGQIYVLDFWATWCGPCIRTIPHLNALSKKYEKGDVTVIGVAIWPREGMIPTDEFVADKGEKMSYTIAEDIDSAMSDAFMKPTGNDGIPTAMIIDRDGVLAWMGHPMAGLEETLEEVVAGRFDREAYGQSLKAKKEAEEKVQGLQREFGMAWNLENWEAASRVAGEIVALHADYAYFSVYKYQALVKAEDAAARTHGRAIVRDLIQDDPMSLNMLAWFIVDPEDPLPSELRDLELARLAAVRADDLAEHKDASIVDTLARVVFEEGDHSRAIKLQMKAVDLASEENPEMAKSLQKTLDEYVAAAEAAGEG